MLEGWLRPAGTWREYKNMIIQKDRKTEKTEKTERQKDRKTEKTYAKKVAEI